MHDRRRTGSDATFPGLPDGEEYRFTACVESWYDGASFGRVDGHRVGARRSSPAGRRAGGRSPWTRRPNVSDSRAEWVIRQDPTSDERVPNQNRVEFSGWGPARPCSTAIPRIQVRYVHECVGDRDAVGESSPRAPAARPTRCRRAGGCRPASAGRTSSPRGDSSNDAGRRQGGDRLRQRRAALLRRSRAPLLAAHRRHAGRCRSARSASRASRCRWTGPRRAGACRPRTRRSRRPATRTCPVPPVPSPPAP